MAPTLQSIWLAEAVTLNEETGRLDIVGAFDRIDVDPVTGMGSSLTAYFAVRGVHGRVKLQLVCVDLANEEPVSERAVFVEGSPLETTDMTVRYNSVTIPHPGPYMWEVRYEDEKIGSARIDVTYRE